MSQNEQNRQRTFHERRHQLSTVPIIEQIFDGDQSGVVQRALVHDPVATLPDHILLGEPVGGLLQLTEREPVAPPEVRNLRHPRAAGAPRRGTVPFAPAASCGRHAAARRLPRGWPVLLLRRRRRSLWLRHGLGELHRGLRRRRRRRRRLRLLAADDLLDVLGGRGRGLLMQVLLEQLGVGGGVEVGGEQVAAAAAAAGEADEDEEEHEHDGGADGDADEHPEAEPEDGRRLRQPPVEVPRAPVRRRRALPVVVLRRRIRQQPPPRPHRRTPQLMKQRWERKREALPLWILACCCLHMHATGADREVQM